MTEVDQRPLELSVVNDNNNLHIEDLRVTFILASREFTAMSSAVNKMSNTMDKMSGAINSIAGHMNNPGNSASICTTNTSKTICHASDLYRQRRLREKMFNADLFGEPAWDILLDLYDAIEKGKRISVSSAGIASNVAATTALRWLLILEEHGLIERENDITDKRRNFVRLSTLGRENMELYMAQC